VIEKTNLSHLLPVFGPKLISDIDPKDIANYQKERQLKKPDGAKGASPKTVNLEVGTLRAILRRYRVWASIQPDVKMLPVEDKVGRAITPDEEAALLKACATRRSRSLPVGVTVGLNTGMRLGEVRLLRWSQLDFIRETITVGKSKTAAGKGRVIPMTKPLLKCLVTWARNFPDRKPEHYVFPYERYGAAGDDLVPCVYDTDPTKPIGSWKNGWTGARRDASVQCRFHDFRHTAATRMLEAQPPIPFQVVVDIMGWSPATAIRMAKRYGHIGQESLRNAVNSIAAAAERLTPKSENQPEIEAGSFDNPFDLEAGEDGVALN
jgi:integrase